jgi:hypothetical protein
MMIADAVLREAARLALQERGSLLFMASDAGIGRSAAALRHVSEVEASAFVQGTRTLAADGDVVISAMIEQSLPLTAGLAAMFP